LGSLALRSLKTSALDLTPALKLEAYSSKTDQEEEVALSLSPFPFPSLSLSSADWLSAQRSAPQDKRSSPAKY